MCSVSCFCGFNFIFVDEVQQVFARRNAQLGIDVTDVGAYGVFGEEKLPSNITVIVAAAKVVQNLGFARRNAELLSQFVGLISSTIRPCFSVWLACIRENEYRTKKTVRRIRQRSLPPTPIA